MNAQRVLERWRRAATPDRASLARIEPGTPEDAHALAHWHYRSGPPATQELVLRAVVDGERVGVLVVSRPTLNSGLRRLAWPGAYDTPDRGENARRLNAEVRTISRVIVTPSWRGVGVATRLVRAYLADPRTPRTEALAAMGLCSPFFERAGMRRYELGWSRPQRRLLDLLDRHGLRPWDLIGACGAGGGWPEAVTAGLRAWARSGRGTRRWKDEPDRALAQRAGLMLSARPIGYAHG